MQGPAPTASAPHAPHGPSTGWEARLELVFARLDGVTVPTWRRHEGPLRTQRHREGGVPGQCEQVILHPPGGLVGGDSLAISVRAEAEADVLLTAPGCAKFYRSLGAEASQDVAVHVGRGARLEWLPQPNLVFDGAIAALSFRLEVEDGGRALVWEIQALGRSRGPSGPLPFRDGRLASSLEVRLGGALALGERSSFTADDPWRDSPLGLGGASVFGTFIAVHPERDPVRDLLRAVPSPPGVRVGATSPIPGLTVVRALGDCGETLFRHFSQLRDASRVAILGAPCPAPRIWFT